MLGTFAFFLLWGAWLISGIPQSFSSGLETLDALSKAQTPDAYAAASYAWRDVWGRLLFSLVSVGAIAADAVLFVRLLRIYHAFSERGRLHELIPTPKE